MPLVLSEITTAAIWYPIVFVGDVLPGPAAVLGIEEGENLFVAEDGGWRDGAYVPAAIRRFPFALEREGDAVRLCVEDMPDVLTPGGRPFFNQGKPSSLAQNALDFCCSLMTEERLTAPFLQALEQLDLLVDSESEVTLASGETLGLTGFKTLDATAVRTLDDATFLELRRNGWLAAIFAQINSAANWSKLNAMTAVAEAPAVADRRRA